MRHLRADEICGAWFWKSLGLYRGGMLFRMTKGEFGVFKVNAWQARTIYRSESKRELGCYSLKRRASIIIMTTTSKVETDAFREKMTRGLT